MPRAETCRISHSMLQCPRLTTASVKDDADEKKPLVDHRKLRDGGAEGIFPPRSAGRNAPAEHRLQRINHYVKALLCTYGVRPAGRVREKRYVRASGPGQRKRRTAANLACVRATRSPQDTLLHKHPMTMFTLSSWRASPKG